MIAWSARETYREQIAAARDREPRDRRRPSSSICERGLDIRSVQTVIDAIPLPDRLGHHDHRRPAASCSRAAASRSATSAVASSRRRRPIQQRARRRSMRVGVDGVERVFANAVFAAGPWLVSVGIPTDGRVSTASAPIVIGATSPSPRRHASSRCCSQFVLAAARTRARSIARVAFAARVASGDLEPPHADARCRRSRWSSCRRRSSTWSTKLREAREAVAAQVAEERRMREELAVAAAAGDPPGAAGGDRRARVRRRARAEQSAAGDSRLRRAAADAQGSAAARRAPISR